MSLARRLEWAPAENNYEKYKPNVAQVRFRGIFAPIPRVVVHGTYHETDFVEAALIEIGDGGVESIIPRALDGCLVRLIDRWENKQFENRIASFSRLKILHGERNKHYRLRITWYELMPDAPGTYLEVATVTSEQAFTIRAHHSKRGAVEPDEEEPVVVASATSTTATTATTATPAPPRKRRTPAGAGQSSIGIPIPSPAPFIAPAPVPHPYPTAPASHPSHPIYSLSNQVQAPAQYVHAYVNNTGPILRLAPRMRQNTSPVAIVRLPSRAFPSTVATDLQYPRPTEDFASGLRRSPRLSVQGNSNSSLSGSIAASSSTSVHSIATASSGTTLLTDSREAQLHADFSDEEINKFLAEYDAEMSALGLPEQRRGSGFFSRGGADTPSKRGH